MIEWSEGGGGRGWKESEREREREGERSIIYSESGNK